MLFVCVLELSSILVIIFFCFLFTKTIHHLKFTIGAHTTEESKREQQTRHRQGIDTSIKVERDD